MKIVDQINKYHNQNESIIDEKAVKEKVAKLLQSLGISVDSITSTRSSVIAVLNQVMVKGKHLAAMTNAGLISVNTPKMNPGKIVVMFQ